MHEVEKKKQSVLPSLFPARLSKPSSSQIKTQYKAYDGNTIHLGFVPQRPNLRLEKYRSFSNCGLRHRKHKTNILVDRKVKL